MDSSAGFTHDCINFNRGWVRIFLSFITGSLLSSLTSDRFWRTHVFTDKFSNGAPSGMAANTARGITNLLYGRNYARIVSKLDFYSRYRKLYQFIYLVFVRIRRSDLHFK